MKLKNKYSKQNIYNNQKFKNQIWYNQQIMIFLNFSQLPESVFRPNFPRPKFSTKTLSWKSSQIFLWLECVFRWPTFLTANKHRKVWKVISRKPFSRKQTQQKRKTFFWKPSQNFLWLKSVFRWPTFLMANKHGKVWKVVSRKLLPGKQTWPKTCDR